MRMLGDVGNERQWEILVKWSYFGTTGAVSVEPILEDLNENK